MMSSQESPVRGHQFVRIFAGLFVLLFPVRLALVLMVAPEIPYYDEWDAVIDGIARPLLSGNFSPNYLFAPHNEHVLFWTRGLNYLLLRAGDLQFDNVPVCEISQLVYAGIAASLIALAAINLGSGTGNAASTLRPQGWFVASASIAALLPYAWENIGMGWGNSYYFLLGFSMATIIFASVARGSAGALVLLGIAAIAAGVSMGSGFFACIAGLLALILRVRIGALSARRALRVAVVLLLATALTVALLIRPSRVPIEWSVLQSVELLVVLLLLSPAWILLLRLWQGHGSNADVAFVCVAVWGLMQVCAILLGRPAFRLWYPISRYVDVLALTAFAGIGCLCRLAIAEAPPQVWTALSRIVMVAAIVLSLAFAPFAWNAMNQRADNQRAQTAQLIRYIHAGDAGAIEQAPADFLPYPQRDRLRRLLDAPDVRRILGDEVGTRAAPSAFVDNVRVVNAALASKAIWILPLTTMLGLLILTNPRRRARRLSV
jgi:hypothetical protein